MEAKDKIKQHITELGISQSDLARLSGLAFGTINRILNGKQELLPNTMAKIAEALNLSVSQLMDDDSQEIMFPNRQRNIFQDDFPVITGGYLCQFNQLVHLSLPI